MATIVSIANTTTHAPSYPFFFHETPFLYHLLSPLPIPNPLSSQREPSSSSSSLPNNSLPRFNFFFFLSNALEFLQFGLPATHPLLSRSNARRVPCEMLRGSRPCPASSVFIPLHLSLSFQTMGCYPRNVSALTFKNIIASVILTEICKP